MAGNFERAASGQTKTSRRCFLGQRHVVSLFGFLSCYLLISNRMVLGVAIVAMVKHRQKNETSKWNTSEISCPLPSDPSKSGVGSNFQGEFDWSPELQGYLLGVGFLSHVITQMPAGKLADAIGSKSLLVFSNAVAGILTIISPFAARWHVYALIAVQFLRGASQLRAFLRSLFLKDVKSPELQGYLLGVGFLSHLITQMPAGKLADAIGSKSLLVFSNAVAGILTIISPFAARWHVYALIAVQFLRGASQGFGTPAMYKMTSNWIPRTERGTLSTLMVCGYPVGMAVTGLVTGWVCDIPGLGWTSAFYIWGTVCVVIAVAMQFMYYEHPVNNPWITEEELKYITDGLETKVSKKQPSTPWRKIFTSIPCYAYFYGLFGNYWAFTHFLTVQPTFFGTVLHYSMAENGLTSCLPALITAVSGVLSSMMSHWITKKNLMSLNKLRKFTTGFSAFGFSLCMAGILLTGCDAIVNILFFALSLFSLGIGLSGIAISGVDMAPVFAGSLMGVATAVAGIASALVPVITGLLTTHETLAEWRIVFLINLGVVGSSGLLYVLFGSAEVQPWNYLEGEHSVDVATKETKHKDQTVKSIRNQPTQIEEKL